MTNNKSSQDIYYAVAHRSQEEISSFKNRYQEFDTTVIPSIFKEYLGLDVTNFRQAESWGSSHVIYFVQTQQQPEELVFRANLGFNKNPEVVMLTEKFITDAVAKAGVPTNRVLEVDISRKNYSFDFQIQEKLVGDDLEDHFAGSKQDYDRMSYQLGELIAKYHTIEYPGFGKFDDSLVLDGKLVGTKKSFYEYFILCLESDLEYLIKAEVITSEQATKIIKLIEDHKSVINLDQGVLIHHDLADHNIMFADNKITGVFDWEAMVVGDPVLDLASCPTWRTHHPREDQMLAGYKSIATLPDNFEDKKNIYLLRTMLWKTVYATRIGIMNSQRKDRFSNVMKIFSI